MVNFPIPTNKEKEKYARTYLDKFNLTPCSKPAAIIMAGIPGAGKTEYALELVEKYKKSGEHILVIDLDEVRKLFPNYTGENAHNYQSAASTVVDRIVDITVNNRYNFILDGTLQNYDVAHKNISRLLLERYGYRGGISIHYVIRNKDIAWEFTQKREKVQHRKVDRPIFDEACKNVVINVKRIKEEFKDEVEVNLIIKPNDDNKSYTVLNISSDHPELQKVL